MIRLPSSMIEITPVRSRRERREFIELPFRLYREDPLWVPPLRRDIGELIDPKKHPFHLHSDVQLFLARHPGGRVAGRIAAIHNRRHLEQHADSTGFFGLFETEHDPAIAGALLDAASSWLKERGLRTMRGPANFSCNEDWGLLVDGFDRSPVVMMPYNPQWYEALLIDAGCRQVKDLVAYLLPEAHVNERLARGAEIIARRHKIRIRELDLRRFDEELRNLRLLYNTAWEHNWGAVPLTSEEFEYMGRQLRPVVEPSLVLFAYIGDQLVGFGLALPDLNVVLKRMNGRLLPFGWLHMFGRRRKIDLARCLALGVLPEYRATGAAEMLYIHLLTAAPRIGITKGDFSWVLADNMGMRSALEKMGAHVYKTYRLYDRPVA